MILVDTSVWINRLRRGAPGLETLVNQQDLMAHPFVLGELVLGGLRSPDRIIRSMREMWQAAIADDDEVIELILHHRLAGAGIGYVDAHLLAAARLTPEGRLWTDDLRLRNVARRLNLAFEPNAV
jgi:predicted nucleic acid-binding protein